LALSVILNPAAQHTLIPQSAVSARVKAQVWAGGAFGVAAGATVFANVLNRWRSLSMLNQQQIEAEEEQLRQRADALPAAERQAFYQQLTRELRDPDTYATLNWCFLAGLHHFYLGQWLRGGFNLAVFIIGVLLLFGGAVWLGLALIVAISVVELWALFRAQIIIQNWNNQIMRRLLDNQTRR
jgi:TM2 domain-containing membrane protein YozV